MTLYEYKQLEETEQAIALWDKGVHLGERFNGEHNILLYQMDGFYVEVFYHPDCNAIVRIRSFKSTGQLLPYLDQMDVAPWR
jgi:hypothetical protein